jgi:hypothetical protein
MWTVHTSHAGTGLFGQVGLFWQWDLCLPIGATVGIAALGLWAILKAKRWRDEAAELGPISPDEQIGQFQKMVEEGILDPEELARIKARLESRPDPETPKTDATDPPPNQPPGTSIQEK